MEKRQHLLLIYLCLPMIVSFAAVANTVRTLHPLTEEFRCPKLLESDTQTAQRERWTAIQKLKDNPTLQSAYDVVDKIFDFEGEVQGKDKRGRTVQLHVSKTQSGDDGPWIRITLSDPSSVRQDGDRTFFYKEDQFNISRKPHLDVKLAEGGFIKGQVYLLLQRGLNAQREDLGPLHEYLLIDVDPSGSAKNVMIANGYMRTFASLWDRLNIVLTDNLNNYNF